MQEGFGKAAQLPLLLSAACRLQSRHEFRDAHVECRSEQFKIADADFLPAVFQIRYEAAVHSHMFRHVNLCPFPLLAKRAQSFPKADADIAGHARNYGCRLSPINRL